MMMNFKTLIIDESFEIIRKVCIDNNHIYIFGIEGLNEFLFSPKLIPEKISGTGRN